MDKRQFLEQLIIEIRSMDISYIVGNYMELKRRGRSFLGLCPFHNDKSLGSFVVTPGKNIFKCFACDIGGDAIKFVAELYNLNYVEAAFKVGVDLSIISSSDYEEYFSTKKYSKNEIKQVERQYRHVDKERFKSTRGEDKTVSYIYNLFLKEMKLKDEHKAYLMEERHLSEETIEKRMYKSYPTASVFNKLSQFLDDDLELMKVPGFGKSFMIKDELFATIPGFYQKKEKGEWVWTYAQNKGIIIPIKDANNQIVGLQIRKDERDKGDCRYIWFSSSFALFSDRFQKGASSGSPTDVLYPERNGWRSKSKPRLYITEGRFKSETIVNKFGAPSISLQGVSTWGNIDKEIKKVAKEIKKKTGRDLETIYIAFDADMSYNDKVYDQLMLMGDYIKSNFKEVTIKYLHWDERLGKGIDDLLTNNEEKASELMKAYSKEEIEKIRKKEKAAWDELNPQEEGQQLIGGLVKEVKVM